MDRYRPYNPHPNNSRVGDCTIRAICKATGQSWEAVYAGLSAYGFIRRDMPSANSVWGMYLKRMGFTRHIVDDHRQDFYTVEDFCRDNPEGTGKVCIEKAAGSTLSLIYPYFLFQTLYQAFYAFVIAGETNVTFSYTTPHWHLWYLLATIFYYMLIPMIQVEKTSAKCGILVCSIVVSLLSGYESSIGYYMSLSHFLCFLPFFIAGYYVGHFLKQGMIFEKSKKKILLAVSILFLILAELFILSRPERFNSSVLYGSYGYEAAGHSWKHRAMLMAVGFSWILFMFLTVSPKRIRLISVLGKNSLPIFCFMDSL